MLIFQNCLYCSTFPDIQKKSNNQICPIHRKNDKQINNNYRPVSLLPVLRKIFEKLIFKSLFEYLDKHKLLSEHQSGFRPNGSCTNQLLFIFHDICLSRPYPFKFFKGCLSQILLGPLFSTLSHLSMLILLSKLEVCFQICHKLLTKFGMRN